MENTANIKIEIDEQAFEDLLSRAYPLEPDPENRIQRLQDAITYREAGGRYYTAEESLERLRAAMERGKNARSKV
jgi:hypothetical protein